MPGATVTYIWGSLFLVRARRLAEEPRRAHLLHKDFSNVSLRFVFLRLAGNCSKRLSNASLYNIRMAGLLRLKRCLLTHRQLIYGLQGSAEPVPNGCAAPVSRCPLV